MIIIIPILIFLLWVLVFSGWLDDRGPKDYKDYELDDW